MNRTKVQWLCAAVSLCIMGALSGCTASPATSPSPLVSGTVPPAGDDWSLSQHDLTVLYDQYVGSLQASNQLDKPIKPQLVRFVSGQEWAGAQVACLAKAGFSAEVNAQGGVTYDDIPQAQASAQRLATATCEAQYAIDPRVNLPLPRVRAEYQYRFLVKTVAPCVEKQGFTVSKAPSLQSWLEQYYATARAWDPFAEAATQIKTGSPKLDELYQACPTTDPRVYP